MAALFKGDIDDFEAPGPEGLKRHQLKAAAAPHLPLKDLVNEAPQSSGNFKDLESLLEQLGSSPVFELGKPLPEERFMPKPRVGDCHASHNRALLDD
jgi:hypothetical protein